MIAEAELAPTAIWSWFRATMATASGKRRSRAAGSLLTWFRT